MRQSWRDLLPHLASIEPLAVPRGEPGVFLPGASESSGKFFPVLSIYLDWRPQTTGAHTRAGLVVLKQRLRALEKTFEPRGAAYASFQTDAQRIEDYLATRISSKAQGVALFASDHHHLFEVLETGVPFDNQVSARAVPSLFQLAKLVDNQETAIIALVRLNMARLFTISLGLLREVGDLQDDPKWYHKVRRAHGLKQTRYQRNAEHHRQQFATETAANIERLVKQEQAAQVILAGEEIPIALVREALAPPVEALVQRHTLKADLNEPHDVLLELVEPLLMEAQTEQDRSVVNRLMDEIQADGLGVSGLELTRGALQQGQVDALVLAGDVPFAPETRSNFIHLALQTGARIEIVEQSAELNALGGVGALLRYCIGEAGQVPIH